MSLRSRKRAFTLIELLVVISIIALLVGILLPALGKARLSARNILGLSDSRQIAIAAHIYASNNNGYFPTAPGVNWTNFGQSTPFTKDKKDLLDAYGAWQIWQESQGHAANVDASLDVNDGWAGLGLLIERELAPIEMFFHPVQQDIDMDGGGARRHWWFKVNAGQVDPEGSDNDSGFHNREPDGVAWTRDWTGSSTGDNSSVQSTIIWSGGRDRSDLLPADSIGVAPTVTNCLTEAINVAETTLFAQHAAENQYVRQGNQGAFVRGDGSGTSHNYDEWGTGNNDPTTAGGTPGIFADWQNNSRIADAWAGLPGGYGTTAWWKGGPSAVYFLDLLDEYDDGNAIDL